LLEAESTPMSHYPYREWSPRANVLWYQLIPRKSQIARLERHLFVTTQIIQFLSWRYK